MSRPHRQPTAIEPWRSLLDRHHSGAFPLASVARDASPGCARRGSVALWRGGRNRQCAGRGIVTALLESSSAWLVTNEATACVRPPAAAGIWGQPAVASRPPAVSWRLRSLTTNVAARRRSSCSAPSGRATPVFSPTAISSQRFAPPRELSHRPQRNPNGAPSWKYRDDLAGPIAMHLNQSQAQMRAGRRNRPALGGGGPLMSPAVVPAVQFNDARGELVERMTLCRAAIVECKERKNGGESLWCRIKINFEAHGRVLLALGPIESDPACVTEDATNEK